MLLITDATNSRKVIILIERIEVNMINETVHNFRRGEFGVESIDIDEIRGFIEINYAPQEIGAKKVLIPLENVEKCEYIQKPVSGHEKENK